MFYYVYYYQKSVANDLNALVGASSGHYSKGDKHIREAAVKTGLEVAFKVRASSRLFLFFEGVVTAGFL